MKNQLVYYRLSSAGQHITMSVYGSRTFCNDLIAHPFWQNFIPDFSYIVTEAEHNVKLEIIQSDHYDIELANEKVICHTIPADIQFAVVVSYHLFERTRQQSSEFSIHGSVIAKNDVAIGLIGNISGTGKTSVAAAASQAGWNWVADEKFVIDSTPNYLAGGSQHLQDIKTQGIVSQLNGNLKPATGPISLKALCFPVVTNSPVTSTFVYDHEKFLWHFYDETTRDIRAVNDLLSTQRSPLPSFDTPETAINRQVAAFSLADTLPMVFVKGTPAAILTTLERYLR